MAYELLLEQLQIGATNFLVMLGGDILVFLLLVAIMAIGLYVAKILGSVLRKFLDRLGVEKFLKTHGVHDAFVGFAFSDICVTIFKIYVAIIFLGIAASVADVPMLLELSVQATNYLPLLIQGLVILIVGLVAGDYITDRIKVSKTIPFANPLAIAIELFIAYNALVIAMPLLLPAADPSLLIWSFLVVLAAAAFALALGSAIALGLGMKDVVADVAKKHKDKIGKLF